MTTENTVPEAGTTGLRNIRINSRAEGTERTYQPPCSSLLRKYSLPHLHMASRMGVRLRPKSVRAWTREDGMNSAVIDASILTDHMMLEAASLGQDRYGSAGSKPTY